MRGLVMLANHVTGAVSRAKAEDPHFGVGRGIIISHTRGAQSQGLALWHAKLSGHTTGLKMSVWATVLPLRLPSHDLHCQSVLKGSVQSSRSMCARRGGGGWGVRVATPGSTDSVVFFGGLPDADARCPTLGSAR